MTARRYKLVDKNDKGVEHTLYATAEDAQVAAMVAAAEGDLSADHIIEITLKQTVPYSKCGIELTKTDTIQLQEGNMSTKYNGWANRETWKISLWINNDEGLDMYVNEMLDQTEDAYVAAEQLAGIIKELPDIDVVLSRGGLVADLLTTTLDRVDWYELAEALGERVGVTS